MDQRRHERLEFMFYKAIAKYMPVRDVVTLTLVNKKCQKVPLFIFEGVIHVPPPPFSRFEKSDDESEGAEDGGDERKIRFVERDGVS